MLTALSDTAPALLALALAAAEVAVPVAETAAVPEPEAVVVAPAAPEAPEEAAEEEAEAPELLEDVPLVAATRVPPLTVVGLVESCTVFAFAAYPAMSWPDVGGLITPTIPAWQWLT